MYSQHMVDLIYISIKSLVNINYLFSFPLFKLIPVYFTSPLLMGIEFAFMVPPLISSGWVHTYLSALLESNFGKCKHVPKLMQVFCWLLQMCAIINVRTIRIFLGIIKSIFWSPPPILSSSSIPPVVNLASGVTSCSWELAASHLCLQSHAWEILHVCCHDLARPTRLTSWFFWPVRAFWLWTNSHSRSHIRMQLEMLL